MKKILFALLSLTFLTLATVNAQNSVFKKGNFNASVGIGLLPTYFADKAKVNVLPLSTRIGYNFTDNFNLSLYAGFSSYTSRLSEDFDGNLRQYDNDFLSIGLRGELHAAKTEKWDIYGGFMIGYNKAFVNETIFNPDDMESPIDAPTDRPTTFKPQGSKVLFSGFIGATYFVKPKLGIFGELGYGVSLVNLGVTFKL